MSAESLDRALGLLRLGTTASMKKEELQQAIKACWDFFCNSHVCAWALGDVKLAAAGACAHERLQEKKDKIAALRASLRSKPPSRAGSEASVMKGSLLGSLIAWAGQFEACVDGEFAAGTPAMNLLHGSAPGLFKAWV